MDIERTTSSPRSNRTKSASEKKSKWQEILGYEQDQQTAKLMFRNSKLLPPPSKTEDHYERLHRKTIKEQKLRLKALFRRICLENNYMKMCYMKKPNETNKYHMGQTECEAFVHQLESEVLRKFKKLSNQSINLLSEADYSRMEEYLGKISKWIGKVQQKVQEKYNEKVKNLMDIQQKYSVYQQHIQECKAKEHANSNEEAAFSMKNLQDQIMNLMQKEEQITAPQIDSIYLKSSRDSDSSSSSDSNDSD